MVEYLLDEEGWASLVLITKESRQGAPQVSIKAMVMSSDLIVYWASGNEV